jgi:hypothetical protein
LLLLVDLLNLLTDVAGVLVVVDGGAIIRGVEVLGFGCEVDEVGMLKSLDRPDPLNGIVFEHLL